MLTFSRPTCVVRRAATAVALTAAAVATAAPPVLAASPSAPAAATASVRSRIASKAVHSCLDTSTTDPAHYFLDIYGRACKGTKPQSFTFTPVAGAAAGTYQIGTNTSGQCVVKYRFGLRQAACLATPNPSYDEWTLQPVGATGHDYRMTIASGVASGSGCAQAEPKPNGYPGAVFTVTACTDAANQVFTMAAGLA